MGDLTKRTAAALLQAYDFSDIVAIVDVGGGHGALITTILNACSRTNGIVYDLPHCREGATRQFEQTQVGTRCTFVGGSFFDFVPSGGDAYLLKSVLHDWDDEQSLVILSRCREAMTESARLLVIEMIVPEHLGSSPVDGLIVGTDLGVLTMMEGQERTEREYRILLEAARLRVDRIVSTRSAFTIIEARRV
jgi:hypothetical protein